MRLADALLELQAEFARKRIETLIAQLSGELIGEGTPTKSALLAIASGAVTAAGHVLSMITIEGDLALEVEQEMLRAVKDQLESGYDQAMAMHDPKRRMN